MVKVLILACWVLRADAGLVSTTVGQVKDHVVTSREVILHSYIAGALQSGATKSASNAAAGHKHVSAAVPDLDSKAFGDEASATLMDFAISMEAKNFQAVPVERKEMALAWDRLYRGFKNSEELKRYQYSEREFRELLAITLQARKFISFKAESSTMPITDVEARNYFEQNRSRFGNLPFENFRDTIKGFLAKGQVEGRLREWFEGLQGKYRVRNFISDI